MYKIANHVTGGKAPELLFFLDEASEVEVQGRG